MRTKILIVIAAVLLSPRFSFEGDSMVIDSTITAFEGGQYAYVFYPPSGFQTVTDEAIEAGFSMAYIPIGQRYKSADVVIDINIFKMTGKPADSIYLKDFITEDTIQARNFFGKGLTIRTVDSVFNANKRLIPTYYFNDSAKFIPTVMMSYFNGKSEIIIFELNISRKKPRFQAETIYMNCVRAFKSLIKGDIEKRNKQVGQNK